jgi:hypothetical protein
LTKATTRNTEIIINVEKQLAVLADRLENSRKSFQTAEDIIRLLRDEKLYTFQKILRRLRRRQKLWGFPKGGDASLLPPLVMGGDSLVLTIYFLK